MTNHKPKLEEMNKQVIDCDEVKRGRPKKIKYTAWYCPNGTFAHFVCYNATQNDIDNHLRECKEPKPKVHKECKHKMEKIDDLERLRLIKEWLPDMCSANIELMVMSALKYLRTNAVREWYEMEIVARKLEGERIK